MRIYHQFILKLLRNYIVGSTIAIIGVGGLFIFSILDISPQEFRILGGVLFCSLLVMIGVELIVFLSHIKPIRVVFDEERPSLEHIQQAYLHAQRFPFLAVKRIYGPHLLGLSIPAIAITLMFIHQGLLTLPNYYVALAGISAFLIASMHALIEFFLTSSAIRPLMLHIRTMGLKHYRTDISMQGRVLVSVRHKLQFSAFLISTFPLLLFSLAMQIRLYRTSPEAQLAYWEWAAIILLLGIGFASFGAWLLYRDVQRPIAHLVDSMDRVREGRFDIDVYRQDLYSDEFSKLIGGFNDMVRGLRERERMNSQLLASYFSTLAAALDARDTYTAGHSERVAEYAVQIGQQAGLGETELDLLEKTALLHDIGKIGVPDAVLFKEGRLTDDEFDLIKRHPVLGESILLQIEPPETMAPYLPGVRSHHERYDGKGYPDGLSGTDIPLFGRIIAVADAFDAMTSDRPYRKGMSQERALAILTEGKGTQWDAEFVQHFIDSIHLKS